MKLSIEEILEEASGLYIRNEVISAVNSFEANVPYELLPQLYDIAFKSIVHEHEETSPMYKDHTILQGKHITQAIKKLAKRLNLLYRGKDIDIVVCNMQDSFMFVSKLLSYLEFDFEFYTKYQYDNKAEQDDVDNERYSVVIAYEETDQIVDYCAEIQGQEVYLVGPNKPAVIADNRNFAMSAITLVDDESVNGYVCGYGKKDHNSRWPQTKSISLMEKI